MTKGLTWIASYPKSGNTWFRAFIYNLINNNNIPADINKISTGEIASSREWLDEILGIDTADLTFDEIDTLRPAIYEWTAIHEEERIQDFHKIHDAYTFNRNGTPIISPTSTYKALYIIRNPLDVVPSYANFRNSSHDEIIKIMNSHEHMMSQYKKGQSRQTRQKLLTWSQHVLSWADIAPFPCLVIRYEDMLQHPEITFKAAVNFLGLSVTDSEISRAIVNSSFKELSQQEKERGFRERPSSCKNFFRQGQSGTWRTALTQAQINTVVTHHKAVMQRFGYLDSDGNPV